MNDDSILLGQKQTSQCLLQIQGPLMLQQQVHKAEVLWLILLCHLGHLQQKEVKRDRVKENWNGFQIKVEVLSIMVLYKTNVSWLQRMKSFISQAFNAKYLPGFLS